MYNLVFVHGTGVREPRFGISFSAITKGLGSVLPEATLHPCYWGGKLGSDLGVGLSISQYRQSKSTGEIGLPRIVWQVEPPDLASLRAELDAQMITYGHQHWHLDSEEAERLATAMVQKVLETILAPGARCLTQRLGYSGRRSLLSSALLPASSGDKGALHTHLQTIVPHHSV